MKIDYEDTKESKRMQLESFPVERVWWGGGGGSSGRAVVRRWLLLEFLTRRATARFGVGRNSRSRSLVRMRWSRGDGRAQRGMAGGGGGGWRWERMEERCCRVC